MESRERERVKETVNLTLNQIAVGLPDLKMFVSFAAFAVSANQIRLFDKPTSSTEALPDYNHCSDLHRKSGKTRRLWSSALTLSNPLLYLVESQKSSHYLQDYFVLTQTCLIEGKEKQIIKSDSNLHFNWMRRTEWKKICSCCCSFLHVAFFCQFSAVTTSEGDDQ